MQQTSTNRVVRALTGPVFLPLEEARVVRSPEGSVHVWTPAPGVLVTRVAGCLTIDGGLALGDHFRKACRSTQKLLVLHDWKEMTDYTDIARSSLLQLGRDVRPELKRVNVLVRSPVVAFGVRTAGLILKSIRSYTVQVEFEAVLRAALRAEQPGTDLLAANL